MQNNSYSPLQLCLNIGCDVSQAEGPSGEASMKAQQFAFLVAACASAARIHFVLKHAVWADVAVPGFSIRDRLCHTRTMTFSQPR